MNRRRLAGLGLIAGLILPLVSCKVVPIGEDGAAQVGFDASGYAAALWTERALPQVTAAARPVAEVVPAIMADLGAAGTKFGYRAGEGSPWSFVVAGTGVVTTKNTASRAGTLDVTVAGMTAPVVLLIGPVIRGNAVRDALPFVTFQDFTNQIEYADVGKALTALALAEFSGNVDAIKVGDTISFTGTISMAGATDRLLITPVSIAVGP